MASHDGDLKVHGDIRHLAGRQLSAGYRRLLSFWTAWRNIGQGSGRAPFELPSREQRRISPAVAGVLAEFSDDSQAFATRA